MRLWKTFALSFKNAWHGLLLAFKSEFSFRLQVVAALAIGILTFLLPLERWERSVVILVMAAVLVLELVNSIVERFVDMVKPRINDYARQVKDLAAAAVLIMAVASLVLAGIIFWPYLYLLKAI